MAVQDDLAASLAAIAFATARLNTIADQATAAIGSVTATYNDRLSGLRPTFYVNQTTGSDSNPGTAAAPLKTIQAAVNKAPIGSFVSIPLQTDYTIDSYITVPNRFVIVGSDSSVKRQLNFARALDTTVQPNARVCYGFLWSGIAGVALSSLTLIAPAMDSFNTAVDNSTAAMFKPTNGLEVGGHCLSFFNCDLQLPTTGFGALVNDNWPLTISVAGLALTGAVTSLNGRVVRGVTATGGTAANTIPQLVTNLTTV